MVRAAHAPIAKLLLARQLQPPARCLPARPLAYQPASDIPSTQHMLRSPSSAHLAGMGYVARGKELEDPDELRGGAPVCKCEAPLAMVVEAHPPGCCTLAALGIQVPGLAQELLRIVDRG